MLRVGKRYVLFLEGNAGVGGLSSSDLQQRIGFCTAS